MTCQTTLRLGLTPAELLALPAAVDLETAGRAMGLGRTKSHELARAGDFPVRVLRLGRSYRVATADILALLNIERPADSQQDGAPAA